MIICGPRRGRFLEPIPVKSAKIEWVDDEGRRVRPPRVFSCEDPGHMGRVKKFPYSKMYVQKWRLTPKELRDAVKEYDMFSLEMRLRIICPGCRRRVGLNFKRRYTERRK